MSEADKVFAGSIPENYDRYLVPLIFESFAQDMAQRVGDVGDVGDPLFLNTLLCSRSPPTLNFSKKCDLGRKIDI
jgi:hypothetical protein